MVRKKKNGGEPANSLKHDRGKRMYKPKTRCSLQRESEERNPEQLFHNASGPAVEWNSRRRQESDERKRLQKRLRPMEKKGKRKRTTDTTTTTIDKRKTTKTIKTHRQTDPKKKKPNINPKSWTKNRRIPSYANMKSTSTKTLSRRLLNGGDGLALLEDLPLSYLTS